VETSAKTGENVQQAFLLAAKMLYFHNKDSLSEMVSLSASLTVCVERQTNE
jgi:hypothetical protein